MLWFFDRFAGILHYPVRCYEVRGIFLLFVIVVGLFCFSGVGLANDPSVPYLKYQEPQPASLSWFSTGVYVFSLILTFVVILVLAYFSSRFLGYKLSQNAGNGDSKILSSLLLGPNRAVYVVEVAGKCMVLGVTEHQITLLQEINSPAEIADLRAKQNSLGVEQFDTIFRRHLTSLQQMTNKFPAVFGSNSPVERPADKQEKR